jgi:hypothetical protein
MTSNTDGANATITYGYDLRGNVTSIAYPNSAGTVSYHYDVIGRADTITDWRNQTTSYTYNPDSALLTQANANGTTGTYGRDTANRNTSISHAPTTAPTSPLASLMYGRDGIGQLTSVTSSGVTADTHTYGYTPLNQVDTVDSATYDYDPADNLTKQTTGTVQVYDAANQLCWTNPTATSGTCGSPTLTATTYSYDNRGNRTQRAVPGLGTSTYSYDQANRLTAVNQPPPAVAAGVFYSLALRPDGTLWSWGDNGGGELGYTTSNPNSNAETRRVDVLRDVRDVAGDGHTLAVTGDGTVWAFGYNHVGQLGQTPSSGAHPTPTAVPGISNAVKVAAGAMHSLALTADGSVWSWGGNYNGETWRRNNLHWRQPDTGAGHHRIEHPAHRDRRYRSGWQPEPRHQDRRHRVGVGRVLPRERLDRFNPRRASLRSY